MTDVPAFSLQAIALLVGLLAFESTRAGRRLWVIALVIALGAFTIREYAVAAPLALGVVALGVTRLRRSLGGGFVVMSLVTWFAAAVAIYGWRSTTSTGGSSMSLSPTLILGEGPKAVVAALGTVSLAVWPVVVLALVSLLARATGRRLPVGCALAVLVGAAAVLLVARKPDVWLYGNIVTDHGAYAEASTVPRSRVLVPGLWTAMTVLACLGVLTVVLAVALLLLRVLRERRSPVRELREAPIARLLCDTFVLMTLAVVLLVGIGLGSGTFDRYFLPALPYLAGSCLTRVLPAEGAARRGLIAGLLVLLSAHAVLAAVLIDHAAARDGLKWQAATGLTGLGYREASINGGLEWFGLHQPGLIKMPTTGAGDFWLTVVADPLVCVTVREASAAVPDGALVAPLGSVTSFGGVRTALRAEVTSSQAADARCPVPPRNSPSRWGRASETTAGPRAISRYENSATRTAARPERFRRRPAGGGADRQRRVPRPL